ncbi:hypothetical protein [Bacillus massilinigeriensis]|uniref:hypothetical protein n=1 Tax=Bacillus massilionigeriensis TaxID=1805475 RepID=UPI001F1FC7D6|nr:hypothetical protein [Bacillus massilionigeriensis]
MSFCATKYGKWIDWDKDTLLLNGIDLEDQFNQMGVALTEKVKQDLGGKYKVKYTPSKSARNYEKK